MLWSHYFIAASVLSVLFQYVCIHPQSLSAGATQTTGIAKGGERARVPASNSNLYVHARQPGKEGGIRQGVAD